jgi:hypothetical protein
MLIRGWDSLGRSVSFVVVNIAYYEILGIWGIKGSAGFMNFDSEKKHHSHLNEGGY